jgi:Cof subfamily protein (haloacid dehalogenase superfamily)
MNAIKLIVTDLDNTLLRRDKTISGYTEDVFRRVRGRGILVAFATARPKRAALTYARKLSPGAMIVHNGAAVYENSRVLYNCGIDFAAARRFIASAQTDMPGLWVSLESNDVLYSNADTRAIWKIDSEPLDSAPKLPVDKLILSIDYPNPLSAADLGRFASHLPDGLYVQLSDGNLALVMNKGATKAGGVNVLAKHFGCSLGEVAAFGDDYNDIEIIRNCGVGVAMANALDEAKAAAGHVCGDCDEDGVAKWMEENLL